MGERIEHNPPNPKVSARVTSGQRGLSDLNQRYFELEVSQEPQGLGTNATDQTLQIP